MVLRATTYSRDQQAREKLKQKAKIKSQVYIQLGEEALQTVHRTFAPDIPVIFHLPALVDGSVHSDSLPTLYVIQEGINCMETTDYFFTNIKPAPTSYMPSSNSGSSFTTNPPLTTRQNQSPSLYAH